MRKFENKFEELYQKMTYKEFLTQLIMFEKKLSRQDARAKALEFMEADHLSSIFEMQELFKEKENESEK